MARSGLAAVVGRDDVPTQAPTAAGVPVQADFSEPFAAASGTGAWHEIDQAAEAGMRNLAARRPAVDAVTTTGGIL